MMNFVLDDAEFCTKSLDEIAQFLKDRENTAIWYTDDCGLADIRFSPIDSEPLFWLLENWRPCALRRR